MADQKILKSRLVQKHEYEVDWNNAVNFIPLEAEIIVYNAEADQNGNLLEGVTLPEDRTTPYTYARIKIGDGVTKVKDLPFVDDGKPGEITITGANYGQSDYAEVCGERFNDYEGNKALAAGSHAEGVRSIEYDGTKQTVIHNVAGCGCFEIDSKNILNSYYYYPNFNTANKTITVKGDASAYAAGDVISVITDTNFDECATIASVAYNGSDKTVITLQEWPEGLIQGSNNILFDSDNVVKSYVPMTLRVIAKPLVGTTYLGLGAHTEGVGSRALADGAHAEGRETQAVGRYGHTEGRETKAHYAAHAEGWKSQAIGNHAHAEGEATKAFGYNAHAEGDSSTASGKTSHAEGYDTKAEGSMSHAEGNKTQATGYASHAEGDSNIASNNGAHAEGYNTKAIGQMAHAEGRGTVAGFVQEDGTIAGTAAHAEGNNTGALAYCAHAEGNETIASGQYSHSEGHITTASGLAAHTEGNNTKALVAYAHAEGQSTIVGQIDEEYGTSSGIAAHAEGSNTQALGDYSHAEGYHTKAMHYGSHAGGKYTETGAPCQTVIGSYNLINEEALFIVGNGVYDADSSIREQKNAFEVYQDGHAELQKQGEADNAVVINSTLNAKAAEIVEQLHGTGINREVVETLPAIEEANDYTIYMVNNSSSSENNIYNEYLLINNNWEMIGSTEVDLTNYYIKKEVDDKVNVKPGAKTTQGGEIFNDVANIASGSLSHAEGHATQALGYAAHAEGDQTQAQKSTAHAEGFKSIAMSESSHAEGENTQAIGSDSHAEGRKTKAGKVQADGTVIGTTAHAEGNWTTAEAYASHAEGSETLASAQYAHAEGLKSKAQGDAAHAEGGNTTASNDYAHAEGSETIASGPCSHAEGLLSAAYGEISHAEGSKTIASGDSSHAEGENTEANHHCSHAGGYATRTGMAYQTVIGKYNKGLSNTLFEVGNGTANTEEERNNAFEVYTDGHAELRAQGETDNSVVIKATLDAKYNELNSKIENSSKEKDNPLLDLINYELMEDDTIKILGYKNDDYTSIIGEHIIPNTIDGYPVTVIGESAFDHCYGLTKIILPNSLKTIEIYAFRESGLKECVFNDGLQVIEDGAFELCPLEYIDLPNSVQQIGDVAFAFNENVKFINLGLGVTKLPELSGNKITNFTISDNITDVIDACFMHCAELSNVIIGKNIKSITQKMFDGCSSLEHIIIPNNITTIDIEAFAFSGLKTITIPTSVTTIGDYAFGGTPLTDIYYEGTEEQWNSINIGSDDENIIANATIHFNQAPVTKEDIANSGRNSNIVISETEPINVPDGTIWVQPIEDYAIVVNNIKSQIAEEGTW